MDAFRLLLIAAGCCPMLMLGGCEQPAPSAPRRAEEANADVMLEAGVMPPHHDASAGDEPGQGRAGEDLETRLAGNGGGGSSSSSDGDPLVDGTPFTGSGGDTALSPPNAALPNQGESQGAPGAGCVRFTYKGMPLSSQE